MSKIIKGTLNVGKTAYSNGKSVVTTLNSQNRDSTTKGFTVNSYTNDQFLSMISALPISNFIPNENLISTSNFSISFNSVNPALLSGNYLELPIVTINLTTIKSDPSSTIFYVYISMVQGIAAYKITTVPVAESGNNGYNNCWIGTIQTNATEISTTNIIARSRIDVFGLSSTAAGSSIPVSTGLPSQNGSISW